MAATDGLKHASTTDVEAGKSFNEKQNQVEVTVTESSAGLKRGTPGLKVWVPVIACLVVGAVVAVFCVLLIPGIGGVPPQAATHSPSTNGSHGQSSAMQQEPGVVVGGASENSNVNRTPEANVINTIPGAESQVPVDAAATPSAEAATTPGTAPSLDDIGASPVPTTTGVPLLVPVEVTPTSTLPSTTSTGVSESSWGLETTYTEQCTRESSDYQYYCTADCMVNCAVSGHSGGLLIASSNSLEAPYCSSQHTLDIYGDSTCCCTDRVLPSEWSKQVIPCLGDASDPDDACQVWCKLRSETLMPYTSIDCDPGGLFCLPFGVTDPDGQIEIECSDSLRCDCDIMT